RLRLLRVDGRAEPLELPHRARELRVLALERGRARLLEPAPQEGHLHQRGDDRPQVLALPETPEEDEHPEEQEQPEEDEDGDQVKGHDSIVPRLGSHDPRETNFSWWGIRSSSCSSTVTSTAAST